MSWASRQRYVGTFMSSHRALIGTDPCGAWESCPRGTWIFGRLDDSCHQRLPENDVSDIARCRGHHVLDTMARWCHRIVPSAARIRVVLGAGFAAPEALESLDARHMEHRSSYCGSRRSRRPSDPGLLCPSGDTSARTQRRGAAAAKQRERKASSLDDEGDTREVNLKLWLMGFVCDVCVGPRVVLVLRPNEASMERHVPSLVP